MRRKVTLIPGEGIGPEVAHAARWVIDAAGVAIEWEEVSPRVHAKEVETELPYARVVEVMDACRAAGIERIGIMTVLGQNGRDS